MSWQPITSRIRLRNSERWPFIGVLRRDENDVPLGLATTRAPTTLGRDAEANFVISAFVPRQTRKKYANYCFPETL